MRPDDAFFSFPSSNHRPILGNGCREPRKTNTCARGESAQSGARPAEGTLLEKRGNTSDDGVGKRIPFVVRAGPLRGLARPP